MKMYVIFPPQTISYDEYSVEFETAEQILDIQGHMIEHNIASLDVYVGSPDCPDSYKSGLTLTI